MTSATAQISPSQKQQRNSKKDTVMDEDDIVLVDNVESRYGGGTLSTMVPQHVLDREQEEFDAETEESNRRSSINRPKSYRSTDLATKKLIVNLMISGGDWKLIARNSQVSIHSCYTWLRKVKRNSNSGVLDFDSLKPKIKVGRSFSKWTLQIELFLEKLIEKDARYTLKEMQEQIEKEYGIKFSTSTISRHLHGKFTLKSLRPKPISMNSLINKAKRKCYVEEVQSYMEQGEEVAVIWMDESNSNLFVSRRQGRAPVGERASIVRCSSKGPNVHFIAGLWVDGIVHY